MKISIDLLNPEIKEQELRRAKFYKIQGAGVSIMLIMTFLASLTIALRVLQSRSIDVFQTKFAIAQKKVTDLKNTQASLIVLKDRLSVINQYYGVSSKQAIIYALVNKIIPANMSANSINIDQSGLVVLTLAAPDAESLEGLINNFTTDESAEKISNVSFESLTRGRDGLFRIGLKLTSK